MAPSRRNRAFAVVDVSEPHSDKERAVGRRTPVERSAVASTYAVPLSDRSLPIPGDHVIKRKQDSTIEAKSQKVWSRVWPLAALIFCSVEIEVRIAARVAVTCGPGSTTQALWPAAWFGH
jgi:hypothetical protein